MIISNMCPMKINNNNKKTLIKMKKDRLRLINYSLHLISTVELKCQQE